MPKDSASNLAKQILNSSSRAKELPDTQDLVNQQFLGVGDPSVPNPSAPPQQFLGQVLDKTPLGGDQVQAEGITPTDSPIDYIAGGLGSKLGSAMARDAGAVVGNEVGAVGKNKIEKLPIKYTHAKEKGLLGFEPDTEFHTVRAHLGDKEIGHVNFLKTKDNLLRPKSSSVDPEYRRQGIATEMYKQAEDKTGLTVSPDYEQTVAAKSLWRQQPRPFGWDMSKMDENSRLARADHMGFDTANTHYHGTNRPFEEFKIPEGAGGSDSYGRGIYVTDSPEGANAYAPDEGGHVLPVHVKIKNPFNHDENLDPKFLKYLQKNYADRLPQVNSITSPDLKNWQMTNYLRQHLTGPEFTKALQGYGYDSLVAPSEGFKVLFDPSQVRSKFAAFDPSKSGSGNLSAGIAGATGLGAASLSSKNANAQEPAYTPKQATIVHASPDAIEAKARALGVSPNQIPGYRNSAVPQTEGHVIQAYAEGGQVDHNDPGPALPLIKQGSAPKDLGNTQNLANRMFADSLIGDQRTQDTIVPADSPIDYVAGGLGAKLGGAMARDAGAVVGNDVGALNPRIYSTGQARHVNYEGAIDRIKSNLGVSPEASNADLLKAVNKALGNKNINQQDLAMVMQHVNTPKRYADGGDVQARGPVDLGNTQSMANSMFAKGLADAVVGSDDGSGQESSDPGLRFDRPAQVSDSPIDYVAGGLGSKLGGALAKDAGAVVGNEVGAVGKNVGKKPVITSVRPNKKLSSSAQDTIEKIKEKNLTFFDPEDFEQSFIAKDAQGEPIGHLGLDDNFRTQSIKVHPEAQGQGVAQSLYEKALNKNGLLRSSHIDQQLEGGRGLWAKFAEENPYHVRQARNPDTLKPLDYKVWQKDTNVPIRKQEMALEQQVDQLRDKYASTSENLKLNPTAKMLRDEYTLLTDEMQHHSDNLVNLAKKHDINVSSLGPNAYGSDATGILELDEANHRYNQAKKARELVYKKFNDAANESEDPREKIEKQITKLIKQHKAINKKSGHTLFNAAGATGIGAAGTASALTSKNADASQSYSKGGQVQHFAEGGESLPIATDLAQLDAPAPQSAVPVQASQAPQFPQVTKVYDLRSGKLGVIPNEQVDDAISSGDYSFGKGQQIPVFHPEDGTLGVIPAEQAPDAFKQGFKYASPQDQHEYQMQQQFGEGVGNMAASAGLGLGNTLSFGGLNHALGDTGLVSQEALKQIPERNPISHFAGELGAFAVPGLGEAGEAAGAGIKGVSALGHGVERGIAGMLPEAKTLAGRVVNSAVSKGVGSGIEGLAYGAGNAVSESALGDPNYNAQAAMSQIGLSGLLGGGLGGVLGVGAVAIPEAVKAASEASNKLKNMLPESVSEAVGNAYDKTASFVSGKDVNDIKTARLNRANPHLGPEDIEKVSKDLSSSIQEQYDSINKANKEAFKDIRPEETANLVDPGKAESASKAYTDTRDLIVNTIKDLRAEPEIYPARYAKKLEGFAASLPDDLNNPSEIFKEINELKQNLDTNIKYGKIPTPADEDAQGVIKTLRAKLKSTLENPDNFGEAASRQAAFNNTNADLLTAQKALQKNFMSKYVSKTGAVRYKTDPVKVNTYLNQIDDLRGASKTEALNTYRNAVDAHLSQIKQSYGNVPDSNFDSSTLEGLSAKTKSFQDEFSKQANIKKAYDRLNSNVDHSGLASLALSHVFGPAAGAIIAAKDAFSNPGLTIQRLAKFEKFVNKTTQNISKGANGLFKASDAIGTHAAGFVGAKEAKTNDTKGFEERQNEILEHSGNPQLLMQKLEKSTDTLAQHAPNNAQALQTQTVNALTFLKSKLPEAAPPSPLGAKIPPTKSDINKFNRYYDAVQNPLGLYGQMKAGVLTPEAVEAVRVVHPDIYNAMQTEIMEHLTDLNGKSVPYKLKGQLALFLGQDLDLSMHSMAIASNQVVQAGAAQEKANKDAQLVNPTVGGLSKINIAQRSLTPTQANAQRGSKS